MQTRAFLKGLELGQCQSHLLQQRKRKGAKRLPNNIFVVVTIDEYW